MDDCVCNCLIPHKGIILLIISDMRQKVKLNNILCFEIIAEFQEQKTKFI
jgi:hypothetical protein